MAIVYSHNDWHLLNQIIYDIYSSPDSSSMMKKFLENIGLIITYDKANFFQADSESSEHFIKNPVSIGFADNAYDAYYSTYEKYDHNNWIFATNQNDAYIMSELLSVQEFNSNAYVREWIIPKGIEHVLLLSLAHKDQFVGVATLFRKKGAAEFTDSDKKIMNLLKKHLALYLYHSMQDNKKHVGDNSLLKKYNLTMRENEILSLILEGKDTVEICEFLHISESTYRKHCSNIYQKLGICKRSELYKVL